MTGAIDLDRLGSTKGWQIGPQNAQGLVDAFNAATSLGAECIARSYPIGPDPANPGRWLIMWQVTVTPQGEPTKAGTVGDWIVYEATTARLYHRSEMPDTFTGSTAALEWAATSAAPTVEAIGGGRVRLAFPRPASPNGPFGYGFLAQDMTAGTGPASITTDGPPSLDDAGNLVAEFAGLTVGDAYRFAVQVSTRNGLDGGQSVISAPTATLTVTG